MQCSFQANYGHQIPFINKLQAGGSNGFYICWRKVSGVRCQGTSARWRMQMLKVRRLGIIYHLFSDPLIADTRNLTPEPPLAEPLNTDTRTGKP